MVKISLFLTALILSPNVFATSSAPANPPLHSDIINPTQIRLALQQQIETERRVRIEQRATFLQLEGLLKSAIKNNNISANALLFNRLIDALNGYPLQTDAMAAYLEGRLKTLNPDDIEEVARLEQDIETFLQKNPQHFTYKPLARSCFALLEKQQKWQEISALAKILPPTDFSDQLRVLNADYQLTLNTLLPTPDSPHSAEKRVLPEIMSRFEQIWLKNTQFDDKTLLNEWINYGGRTEEKIYQKAAYLFTQKDTQGLARLIDESANTNAYANIQLHLAQLQKLLQNPATFKDFANQLPQEETIQKALKFAVIQGFPAYLKTLTEQLPQPDFNQYLSWAKNWRLDPNEIRNWEIAFLDRFFDNENRPFQQWRDNELVVLQADNLTERRLRMAIWQQTDLTKWLQILSPETAQKQEWRYWRAIIQQKTAPQKTREILTALARERGFYPMLAAHKLGVFYRPEQVNFTPSNADTAQENDKVSAKFRSALDEISELRALERFGQAKQRWRFLLENLDGQNKFEQQIALSRYADKQHWFDLSVEGTIVAKAWNELALRLPIAYSNYFAFALNNKTVTSTFAMAIARQESAWNPLAQSSANARGLMQLLPSTAKATAARAKLPYNGEPDLFQPLNNILLGTAHLEELNAQYPNNRILIAAAYNAGSSRVEKWLARANGKLAMDEFIASIPFYETRGYVQNVLSYDYFYQILQGKENPQSFSQEEYDRLY